MNALLDSIVYDRRANKVKATARIIDRQMQDNKRVEKTNKTKSKTVNKDRTNKTVSVEKPKNKEVKSKRQHAATLDNSQFGSIASLASSNDVKIDNNALCNSSDNRTKNKSDEIDPKQLRKKPPKNAENKTDNFIQDAIKGFNYSGSIELKFEEALEVCADNLYDEMDEELGRNLFDDESDNYILEAYNRPGDELIETYMDVEHRTVPSKPIEEVKRRSGGSNGKNLSLISDDEECIFVEAYNSLGYELRKTYSLMDKNASEIDPAFQARTLSITSDVQEYFNDIGDKCETEDQHHPACNTYMNYSKIIHEYKSKQQKSVLQRIDEGKNQTVSTKCDSERDVELPQPSPAIYANYDKTMAELRKSLQGAVSKDQNENDSTSEDNKSNSSDEVIYELPFVEDTIRIKFNPQTKSDFIIHELLETEYVYINNLKKILIDYLNYFRKFPAQSQHKINTIFGNIEAIYRQTIEFYHALVLCSNDYEAIALTFVDYKSLFNLYPIYMKNKPKADRILLNNYKTIIEDRQRKLKDRLDLMSYLLNPIQRLGRYILLLENLQKSVRKSDRLDPAVEILKANMTKGNDAIAVESILQVPQSLDLYTKGSYIDREKFIMIKPRRQEIVIFLFEEVVVFTVENATDRRDVHTTFTYYDSIQMNDLSITIVDGELLTFQLADYPRCKKYKDAGTYIFEARDMKTRDHWGKLIKRKLWEQLERFKDESRSYKSVSRTNSISSAKFINQPYSSNNVKTTSSTSVSRESSAKKVVTNPTDDRQIDKSNDKVKRRTKKQKSDVTKRNSKFYTDPQNYKTM